MARTRSAGFWQSVRDLPGRMPLRTKLISAVLILVAVALVVISSAGLFILRNDLLSTPDGQLQASIGNATSAVQQYLNSGRRGAQSGVAVDWISGGRVEQVILPANGQSGLGGFARSGQATVPGPAVQTSTSWLAANSGRTITLPSESGAARWRVLMQPQVFTYAGTGGAISGTVVLAINVSTVYTTIGQLFGIDLLVSLAVLCVLGVVVVAVIRRSLRPLVDIERTAGAIAEGDLTRRVPEGDAGTEVGRLGRSLNVMLSHIESAFRARSRSEEAARRSEERMRQFVADASHELRTPLTAIRGFAEYYRQRGGIATSENGSGRLATTDMDRIMRRVEQESARMGVLVEDMLLLARLDQQRPLEAKPVDLLTLAADAVHDARVVAPDRSVDLSVGVGTRTALIVIGDEVRLRQVIGNLMTNALTHTPAGTPIDVVVRSGSLDEAPAPAPPPPPQQPAWLDDAESSDDQPPGYSASSRPAVVASPAPQTQRAHRPAAVLEVADHGRGLTREQAEHVFERFYRADPARSSGGTGLGLAIVAALVAAHGGASWVRSTPGHGATFCIALPLAPEAEPDTDDDEYEDVNENEDEFDFDGADQPLPQYGAAPDAENGTAGYYDDGVDADTDWQSLDSARY